MPEELLQNIREISFLFGRAATHASSEEAGLLAQQALGRAAQAAETLVGIYQAQVLQIRHQHHPRLDTTFGCRLGPTVPQGEAAEALLARLQQRQYPAALERLRTHPRPVPVGTNRCPVRLV